MARTRKPPGMDLQSSDTQQVIAKRLISEDLAQKFKASKRRRRRRGRGVTTGEMLSGAPFEFATGEGDREAPTFDVILEMNVDAPGGPEAARRRLLALIFGDAVAGPVSGALRDAQILIERDGRGVEVLDGDLRLEGKESLQVEKSLLTERYLFGRLRQSAIERLVRLKAKLNPPASGKLHALIYKAWPDHELKPFVYESAKTIKADAASIAFSARGEGIVWAVADTGIDETHPHFATHDTLRLPDGLFHLDFTQDSLTLDADMPTALEDPAGHGTHVAGIIAGACLMREGTNGATPCEVVVRRQIKRSDVEFETVEESRQAISGVAPLCKLMSLRVLDRKRQGKVSTLLAAIAELLRLNDYGHKIRVHGLNLSVGYEFDPEWFGVGHSPLCNEVDRLVRIGMVVVVAAGNAGYGRVNTSSGKHERAAFGSTIADPGNAERAITVGSTHRDMPHAYGVSYFSSKGPTADGRAKPDLLAPGERIVSCAAHASGNTHDAIYREDSGTSMAAPHVSGAIAAFLSIRREFIGRPDEVKELFLSTATDLKRLPHYQGRGLVDLMRAIQAV